MSEDNLDAEKISHVSRTLDASRRYKVDGFICKSVAHLPEIKVLCMPGEDWMSDLILSQTLLGKKISFYGIERDQSTHEKMTDQAELSSKINANCNFAPASSCPLDISAFLKENKEGYDVVYLDYDIDWRDSIETDIYHLSKYCDINHLFVITLPLLRNPMTTNTEVVDFSKSNVTDLFSFTLGCDEIPDGHDCPNLTFYGGIPEKIISRFNDYEKNFQLCAGFLQDNWSEKFPEKNYSEFTFIFKNMG
jgi:hypothetical protein